MTMEKYGVDDVQKGQKQALELAKAKLLRLYGGQEKTASTDQEEARLREQISELEAAIAASSQ